MLENQQIGLDLPIRILAWEEDNQVGLVHFDEK